MVKEVRNTSETFLRSVFKIKYQMALVVKSPPANAGEARDMGLIPRSGRSPGGGNGKPTLVFLLGNPMDRGAWWATVHGVAKSQTQLSTHRSVSSLEL